MVRPAVWSDTDKIMWGFDRNGSMSDIGCGTLDLPKDRDFEIASGEQPDCLPYWFTSSKIPGESTLSNEQMQPDTDCCIDRTENISQKYP